MDYVRPDYTAIFAERAERLTRLRKMKPVEVAALKAYYRNAPWDFVKDWGMTFEPRNIERKLLSTIPFIPWKRQVEFMQWLHSMWRQGERGTAEKSRDCGVTWLMVGYACSQFLFESGFTTGFGSRKEELVDKIGDSKSIFEKLRFFLKSIPVEFMPKGWNWQTCSAYMRIVNPETGASIIGEAGDNIGRGGRTSIYLVDEAAFIEHQDLVDAALSQNTNCQIDVSTVNGTDNAFYRKRMKRDGTERVFIFDWRDDPRKDEVWYARQKRDLDPVIVAQEIDRDYNASRTDAFIPSAWVQSCIDAHKVLGFDAQGLRVASFDPADIGDAKGLVLKHGPIVKQAKHWKDGDITQAIPKAFHEADEFRADVFVYDAGGMGAPAIKLSMENLSAMRMDVQPFDGAGAIRDPDAPYTGVSDEVKTDGLRSNKDMFGNFRSQAWTMARDRIKYTHDQVQLAKAGKLVNANPENMVSISSECVDLRQLTSELSRPARKFSNNGKIYVESKKDMDESPNLADAFVMSFTAQNPKNDRAVRINFAGWR